MRNYLIVIMAHGQRRRSLMYIPLLNMLWYCATFKAYDILRLSTCRAAWPTNHALVSLLLALWYCMNVAHTLQWHAVRLLVGEVQFCPKKLSKNYKWPAQSNNCFHSHWVFSHSVTSENFFSHDCFAWW